MPEPLSPFRRLVIAEPGTVRIEVRRGGGEPSLWAVIDIEDWDLIGQYKWYADIRDHTTYARRHGVWMHQMILDPPKGMDVDHADGNGLNNRRENLRRATRTQNLQNRRAHRMRGDRPTTSQYKGVCWSPPNRAWLSYINVDGKREYLGLYPTDVEGAQAYDRRAREAFGPFALLNFPDEATAS